MSVTVIRTRYIRIFGRRFVWTKRIVVPNRRSTFIEGGEWA